MKNRITDHEAELLLAGRTPEGRPDFGELAASVASFRSAAFETVPRPSAALADRLGLPQDALVAAMATSTAASSGRVAADAPSAALAAEAPRTGVIRGLRERVAGFGLATKIAAGVGALALGITATGAAGALPGAMQDAFDDIVSAVISVERDVEGDADVVVVDEESSVEDVVAPADQPLPVEGEEGDGRDEVDPPLSEDAAVAPETVEESEGGVGTGSDGSAESPEYGSGSDTSGSGSGSETGPGSATTDSGSSAPAEETDFGTGVDVESGEPSGGGVRGP